MIYLAGPYTHADPAVMEHRYQETLKMVGLLTNKGYVVYSPIAHFHPVACVCDLPRDFQFWQRINFWMIDRADVLYVLQLDGWDVSIGVAAEIERAVAQNKTIIHLTPLGETWLR